MVGEQKTPLLWNGVSGSAVAAGDLCLWFSGCGRGLVSLARESTSYAGVTRIRF